MTNSDRQSITEYKNRDKLIYLICASIVAGLLPRILMAHIPHCYTTIWASYRCLNIIFNQVFVQYDELAKYLYAPNDNGLTRSIRKKLSIMDRQKCNQAGAFRR